MSAIGNNSNQLARVAHPSNESNHSQYYLQSPKERVVGTVTGTVTGKAMGGMVSAISAVLCGTHRQLPEEHDELEEGRVRKFQSLNGQRYTSVMEKIPNGEQNSPNISRLSQELCYKAPDSPRISRDSSYRTAENSDNEYEDLVETEVSLPSAYQHMEIPYMDEHSDISRTSSTSHSLYVPRETLTTFKHSTKSVNNNDSMSDEEPVQEGEYYAEVIDVSEGEYSADEEQEEGNSETSDFEEIERADSETEGKQHEYMQSIFNRRPLTSCRVIQRASAD